MRWTANGYSSEAVFVDKISFGIDVAICYVVGYDLSFVSDCAINYAIANATDSGNIIHFKLFSCITNGIAYQGISKGNGTDIDFSLG